MPIRPKSTQLTSHMQCAGAGGLVLLWNGGEIGGKKGRPDYSVPHPYVPSIRRFDAETDLCPLGIG